jgi:hypothetical protein
VAGIPARGSLAALRAGLDQKLLALPLLLSFFAVPLVLTQLTLRVEALTASTAILLFCHVFDPFP